MSRIFLAFLVIIFLPVNVYAQQSNMFNFDRTKPVEITADNLTVDDIQNRGDFEGNVDVIQGDFRLRASRLSIFYDRNAKNDNITGQGKIRNLVATGNVTLSTRTESARSNRIDYNLIQKMIYLQGNVLITRVNGTISGETVEINTATRHIKIKSQKNKRVRTVIHLDKLSQE